MTLESSHIAAGPKSPNQTTLTLQQARTQSGLGLRELARLAATSHATLSAYEKGTKCPSTKTFLRILNACGYAVDIQLRPRVRHKNGLSRGEELAQVLKLAGQFPSRPSKQLTFPKFPDACLMEET